MADIHHRLIMSAPADEVFAAVKRELASIAPSAALSVSFLEGSVTATHGELALIWRVEVDGPADWIGTEIVVEVGTSSDANATGTIVRLTHRNWRDTDVMATHTTQWGRVLLGLKKRVEMPDPTDTLV